MALTRDFKATLKARADGDPAFRAALLSDAIELLLAGDLDTGKIVLRNFIKATVGFESLATLSGLPAKSLMRMFGPTAASLFTVISALQKATGVQLEVTADAA
mgnify:CR=1 FL=1